jgi:hypothetical protein
MFGGLSAEHSRFWSSSPSSSELVKILNGTERGVVFRLETFCQAQGAGDSSSRRSIVW